MCTVDTVLVRAEQSKGLAWPACPCCCVFDISTHTTTPFSARDSVSRSASWIPVLLMTATLSVPGSKCCYPL